MLDAIKIEIDSDEIGFYMLIESEDEDDFVVRFQGIDLDAFYDQVKGRIGPYLREREDARLAFLCGPHDVDESAGLDDHNLRAELLADQT